MATNKQQANFINSTLPTDLLDISISWISENMSIDEVFSTSDIQEFCAYNYKPIDVFKDDDLLEYATAGKYPEDIYSEDQLNEWALKNGYVKAD